MVIDPERPRPPPEKGSRPSPVSASTVPAAAFRALRMVRFSDCDPAGIVYTPRFVDMLNGVIEDFFPAALGLDYHGFITEGVVSKLNLIRRIKFKMKCSL